MTDRNDDIRENAGTLIPGLQETSEMPFLQMETFGLIRDTIAFIRRTVSAKALEAALLIGDYILTNYFNDDTDLAFSYDSNKTISFSLLCDHPELGISRRKLTGMVKVAAQERFFRSMDLGFSELHYSHREKLTLLPNDENKIDMARQCTDENLTTRQLVYRIRKQAMEMEAVEDDVPAQSEKTITNLFTTLDQLTEKATSLNFNTLRESVYDVPFETKATLHDKLMTLIGAMDAAKAECENLMEQLQPQEPDN